MLGLDEIQNRLELVSELKAGDGLVVTIEEF